VLEARLPLDGEPLFEQRQRALGLARVGVGLAEVAELLAEDGPRAELAQRGDGRRERRDCLVMLAAPLEHQRHVGLADGHVVAIARRARYLGRAREVLDRQRVRPEAPVRLADAVRDLHREPGVAAARRVITSLEQDLEHARGRVVVVLEGHVEERAADAFFVADPRRVRERARVQPRIGGAVAQLVLGVRPEEQPLGRRLAVAPRLRVGDQPGRAVFGLAMLSRARQRLDFFGGGNGGSRRRRGEGARGGKGEHCRAQERTRARWVSPAHRLHPRSLGERAPRYCRAPMHARTKPGSRFAAASRSLRARGDDLWLSLDSLFAHPLRSALTLLGIVIGVFTVVAMSALMTGLRGSINKGIGALGANTFQITKFPPLHFGPMDPAIRLRKNITVQQTFALREALPQAVQVAPDIGTGGRLAESRWGKAQPVSPCGGTPEMFTNYSWPLNTGREFNEGEALGGARVAVVGASVMDALFPGLDPLGEEFSLGRMRFKVIGTLERQGGSPFGFSPDTAIIFPISTWFELFGSGKSVDITVMARSPEEIPRLQDSAVAAFRRVRGLRSTDENDFDVYSNDSLRATFEEMAGNISMGTLCICALSLLVGGIGVMNIMLVAVAERTREIGLRKALGARRMRILLQFIIEAVLLSLFGGIVGVLFGFGAAFVADFAFAMPAEVPLWSVALGLGVSCSIGLVFGIYPAARASRLDAAVALRSE
jgi:putative ABC transport system permease protein